jgi:methylmalonyl-CoA mutase N-terminal domain/subunit
MRKEKFQTLSGIPVKPFYTPEDITDFNYKGNLGNPGEVPFTRGIYPTMYRGQLWTKRMLIGHETPEIFNARQKTMFQNGTTGINFIPCNSYARGYDSDEVDIELLGRCGTTIDSLKDLEIAFEGIPLDQVTAGFNDPAPFIMVAMYLANAEKQGIPWNCLRGTSNQSDFISHYLSCNMFFRFSLDGHLRILLDHIKFCAEYAPQWNCLSIVGQHMQQAGATPVQALAFALASGIFYARKSLETGLEGKEFIPRFTFFFDIGNEFFEEIAKFRAARRMWAKILKEKFGITEPKCLRMKFHAQTSGVALTRVQPLNNIARVAIHALSAILGGVQSLHTDAYDEALWSPTEEAARIALMTQNILAEEIGLTDVIDPLGGSYYIEYLTNEMEKRAWEYIDKIEEMGGMLEAVRQGYPQREIGQAAHQYQKDIDNQERIVVGVNKYAIEEDESNLSPPPIRKDLIKEQLKRTRQLKKERNQRLAKEVLKKVRGAALDGDGNIFARLIEAVKSNVTQGEIVRELGEVYGRDQIAE